MKTIRILGVHGLGDHRNSTWEQDWQAAIESVFPGRDGIELEFEFLTYDPLFEDVNISAWEAAGALWKLTRSGVTSIFRRRRGVIGDVSDKVKWTAGYVVAWVEDDAFRELTRELMLTRVAAFKPDLILAHSLGSLLTYDAFSHPDAEADSTVKAALRRARYVTLGSQIGNAFVVRNLTPGRIAPLAVKHWYHLYNEEDDVFTAPIRVWDADNFTQVNTFFDIDGMADHSAVEYLTHSSTTFNVWRPVAEETVQTTTFGPTRAMRRRRKGPGRYNHRALLVGINDYPNEEDRLEGCVNDVFLMSSLLQECGFDPESIRVCLDDRATASGILERMAWLLDDPQPNDRRVFYYSGHGATVPEYGVNNEPDRLTETLVPWDFDWSPETAITDDMIYMLYSQLPFETQFAMFFDCCHSGGMHRDGGARARGLNPPDDIRHRALKWDPSAEMWISRDMAPLNPDFSIEDVENENYFGASGVKTRLGRASIVRGQSAEQYAETKKRAENAPVGPYLPLILEACQEEELSYEYRHGVTSYGAFTYALAKCLRRRRRISFADLVAEVGAQLGELGYAQLPQILGPKSVTQAEVPWLRARRR